MPFLNYHAARLQEPSKYDPDTYRTTHGTDNLYGNKVPASINVIWGKFKGKAGPDDPVIPQTLRFDASVWTAKKAKAWLKDHDIHNISFEEATEDVKKMSDADLMESLADLLPRLESKEFIAPSNFAHIKKVYDEINVRKTMHLNAEALGAVLPILKGEQTVTTNGAVMNAEGFGEVALRVLDKMTEGLQGLTRYTLGYALDKTKPFSGTNVIKAADLLWYTIPVRTDESLTVLYKSATPLMIGDKIGVEFEGLAIKGDPRKRPECAKEIIKGAYAGKRLDVSKEMLIEIQKARLLEIDVDSQFGIDVNKTLPIKKIVRSMQKGVFYCVVAEPMTLDTDKDYQTEEDIEDACWDYMETLQGSKSVGLNLLHDSDETLTKKQAIVVENVMALLDLPVGDEIIKKGSWYVAIRVKDPDVKEAIESGELNSLSMEGTASKGEPIPEMEAQKG
jgi:hypothetical protein